ncbi:hypothetical protein [Aquisalimonas sp.]|uniref:hypothetical protein n=1 Tax=Aquisalimonas sp. TaxID=1872621 RepID=UPI0025BDC603|nr:hypothetical protein [Aquisalimonas sp.]
MSGFPNVVIDPVRVRSFFPRRTSTAKLLFALNGALLPESLRRGNWDRRVYPIEDHPTYRLMATLYDNHFSVDACYRPLVQYYIERGRREPAARAHAERRVDDYMSHCGKLCQSLREDGYRAESSDHQIGLAIDRNGVFVKTSEGHHRFALARILGLNRIVADIRWVHTAWYRRFRPRGIGYSKEALNAAIATAAHPQTAARCNGASRLT